MSTRGAFTIVPNEDNKVLLVRRRDFPIWDLPGGRVEINESISECAIRETQEETGYVIKINKKLGEYQRPEVKDVRHLFLFIYSCSNYLQIYVASNFSTSRISVPLATSISKLPHLVYNLISLSNANMPPFSIAK